MTDRWHKAVLWTVVVIADLLVTFLLFQFTRNAVHQTDHNARIQRLGQLVSCQEDNTRAQATIRYASDQLAIQRQSLITIRHLPQFNTPQLRRLAAAGVVKQIDIYGRWLKAYRPLDCEDLYGLPR